VTTADACTVTRHTDPAALAELETEWDALADRLGSPPFLRPAWIGSWWTSFDSGRPVVWAARRGGALVALLPLVARGSVLRSPTNGHTPLFAPLGEPEAVAKVVGAVLPSSAGSLIVGHVPQADESVHALDRASRAARRVTWWEPGQTSPVVDLEGDFDSYLGRLGRHTRRELARLRRKLEAEQGDVRVDSFAVPANLQEELQGALELEASGWKGRRGTAILSRPDTAAFYRRFATAFAARGELRLSTLAAGGRLIAFDLCLVANDRAWTIKGAYDEEYRRYAPGLLLLLAEIEDAYSRGLAAVELLGGADAYKLKFTTSSRTHVALHSHRRLLLPLARLSYHRAARPIMRRAYRALRPR
jgi:CelD/BcsL family acetyltransferase involved in cellulose biosynthesis